MEADAVNHVSLTHYLRVVVTEGKRKDFLDVQYDEQ